VAYFDSGSGDSPEFANKLEMLLTWSVTPLQYGDHRPFACVTLLHHWREKAIQRASRRGSTPRHEFIQDGIFYWLDTSEVAGEPDNIRSVTFLLDNLIQRGLFSYGNYLQRLIARGESGLSYTEVFLIIHEPNLDVDTAQEIGSRHRLFLRWIPLQKSSASLISQRKMTLHGARTRETPEDLTEREIRKEIRAIIPELFGGMCCRCSEPIIFSINC
jgi:mediator of RNA polymerase II transcription subunit 12